MKNLVKFKKDIQNLLIEKYNAQSINKEDVKDIVEKYLKSFPTERFFDYQIFNIKYMKYIIGFDNCYNIIIFYSDSYFTKGFYQLSSFNLDIVEQEKIDLFKLRKKELDDVIKWFKEQFNKNQQLDFYKGYETGYLKLYPETSYMSFIIGPDFMI